MNGEKALMRIYTSMGIRFAIYMAVTHIRVKHTGPWMKSQVVPSIGVKEYKGDDIRENVKRFNNTYLLCGSMPPWKWALW